MSKLEELIMQKLHEDVELALKPIEEKYGFQLRTVLFAENQWKKDSDVELTYGTNFCKYCDDPTDSTDPDVLCENCQAIFGHIFYSEL